MSAATMTSNPPKTATSAAEMPQLGSRYKMLKKLGSGGMGAVFLADDTTLAVRVAVKILLPGLASETIIRFQQEARAAAKLDHPNIVKVRDFGQTPAGDLYLIMDYVGRKSLEDIVDMQGRLPIDEALPIFIQIASGLHHAHINGVCHRDVKPSNIMLNEDTPGNVQLVDFGLAKLQSDDQKLTSTGVRVGSPLYMSPEQAGGAEVGERSDIYSLGCLMFKVLTGQPPLQGKTYIDTIVMQREEIPPLLNEVDCGTTFPQELEEIIAKTLEKDPDDRYQSADELKHALEQALESYTASFKPVPQAGDTALKKRSFTDAVLDARDTFVRNRTFFVLTIVGVGLVAAVWCVFATLRIDDAKVVETQYGKKLEEKNEIFDFSRAPMEASQKTQNDRRVAFQALDKKAMVEEAKNDPDLEEFTKDPEVTAAFMDGSMQSVFRDPERMQLFSSPAFRSVQPMMAKLWADPRLIPAWNDPLCQEFIRQPKLWPLWKTKPNSPKLAKYARSANMKTIMADPVFNELLTNDDFKTVANDPRFQKILKDPKNLKLMRGMTNYKNAMQKKAGEMMNAFNFEF